MSNTMRSVAQAVATSAALLSTSVRDTARSVSDIVNSKAMYINTFNEECCPSCGKELRIGVISGIAYGKEFIRCACCNERYCQNCCIQSKFPIMDKLWHPDAKKTADMIGYVCSNHQRKVMVAYMLEIYNTFAATHVDNLKRYLDGRVVPLIEKPTTYSESALSMRLTKLAVTVASYTHYGTYANALRYAFMGTKVLGLLLNKYVSKTIFSLMPMLEQFNIRTPNDMLCVYYLGCKTELERRRSADSFAGLYDGDRGVLASNCPDDIIEVLGKHVSYAQWLYAASLPEPHDGPDWGNWYLSRITEKECWKIIASNIDSIQLPDGSLCPSFALVARTHAVDDKDVVTKEALLIIRGSKTVTDWRINVTRNVTSFFYRSGPCGENVVVGGVHTGMLVAARAILDVFQVRRYVYTLLDEGHEVRVVGHSLGAGVASILAAELKNGLYRRHCVRAAVKDEPLSEEIEVNLLGDSKLLFLGLDHENHYIEGMDSGDASVFPLPRVPAICYATPPCVGESLADALLADDLIISMVNNNDLVPRLSGQNICNLADEIESFRSTAELWAREDEKMIKLFAQTIGKEGNMSSGPIPNVFARTAQETSTSTSEQMDCVDHNGETTIRIVPHDSHEHDDISKDDNRRLRSGVSTGDMMVVPGKIALFTKPCGTYRVTLCDFRVRALDKIFIVQNCIEEHYVSEHLAALRQVKQQKAKEVKISPSPSWQKVFNDLSGQWSLCSVCLSDPTWPFITHGEPSRALVCHNCRACGKVVCVMCAPAGDSVPASGVGEYQTLSDNRISIPSMGMFSPVRVCMPCYLHSYEY